MRMFPIQQDWRSKHDIAGIPWDFIAEHETYLMNNHNQSLEHMAYRGGLAIHEAYLVVTDTSLTEFYKDPDKFKTEVCAAAMKVLVNDWLMSRNSGKPKPQPVFCILYEDTTRPPEVFVGEGAEEAAKRRYTQAKDNWTCHLLSNLPAVSQRTEDELRMEFEREQIQDLLRRDDLKAFSNGKYHNFAIQRTWIGWQEAARVFGILKRPKTLCEKHGIRKPDHTVGQ